MPNLSTKSWRRSGIEAKPRSVNSRRPFRKSAGLRTPQFNVYRLETKGAVKRLKKVGNFHVFAPAVTRAAAQTRLIDELLSLFGGRTQPVMAHLIQSGKLTLEDIREAEALLRACGSGEQ